MIGKLTGQYGGGAGDGVVLIEVVGVGYVVRVPAGVEAGLKPGVDISLFIYTAVREDAIDLYGFARQEELLFFKQLTSVSGIGPKTAIGILNLSDVPTLKRSIARGDATILTKVFGIGKKSAERIVVELRDKMVLEPGGVASTFGSGSDGEVLEALMALGYSAQESRSVLKEIGQSENTMQERVAAALRYLGSNTKN